LPSSKLRRKLKKRKKLVLKNFKSQVNLLRNNPIIRLISLKLKINSPLATNQQQLKKPNNNKNPSSSRNNNNKSLNNL